jgi:hypothetical protein
MALAMAMTLTIPPARGRAVASPAGPAASPPRAVGGRPRLVVVVSIDQLRADYLERFKDLYLPPPGAGKPGGFRWLMERGAYHLDARHDHLHLFTGPGHAVLLTGAPPYRSGIVGNVPRMLPAGTRAVIRKDSWQRPEIFNWLQRTGKVAEDEMLRVFNCGIGMVLAVPRDKVQIAKMLLEREGELAFEIGAIEKSDGEPDAMIV